MADDTRWMTYAELAETLGIGGDSARNLVRRKRWARQTGNDGMARVGVPVDYIEESRARDGTTDDPADAPSDPAIDGGPVLGILTSYINRLERELQTLKEEHGAERTRLQNEVEALRSGRDADRERLAGEIETLRQERDDERRRAVQVDALNAVIEAERQRIADLSADRDALRADRDRWAAQADKLAEPVEAPAVQPRGWWPFRRAG